MKKNESKIQLLLHRIDTLEAINNKLSEELVEEMRRRADQEADFRDKLDREQEKYAKLLERYITMMERVAKIDEQREAD